MNTENINSHDSEMSGTSCLHLVLTSSRLVLEECLCTIRSGDALVFVDTGVTLLIQQELNFASQTEAAVFYLEADLNAHGLRGHAEKLGISVVNDLQWVALAGKHFHCLSWK